MSTYSGFGTVAAACSGLVNVNGCKGLGPEGQKENRKGDEGIQGRSIEFQQWEEGNQPEAGPGDCAQGSARIRREDSETRGARLARDN